MTFSPEVKAELRKRYEEEREREFDEKGIPQADRPRLRTLMDDMMESAANRLQGCLCDQLPADTAVLAKDPKAHHPECPLADG